MNSGISFADAVRFGGARIDPSGVRSLLIFKLRYIGDVVLTTPAIRLIRRACPDARLIAVVFRGTEAVLRHNPHLNGVVTVDRGRIERGSLGARLRHEVDVFRHLRRERADASIDFDSGERGAYMAWLAGARVRIGFRYQRGIRPRLFTVQVPVTHDRHTVERNLRLVEQAFGVTRTDDHLELHPGTDAEAAVDRWLSEQRADRRYVVVHPGARFAFKQWQAAKWAALIERIRREQGLEVIVAGSPEDRATIDEITVHARPSPLVFVGPPLLEFAALCARAAAFIGNDSGPAHVAAAVGARVVALFGATDPAVWGPWGAGHHVVSSRSEGGARPTGCADDCACSGLHAITVDAVYEAAARVLSASESRAAR